MLDSETKRKSCIFKAEDFQATDGIPYMKNKRMRCSKLSGTLLQAVNMWIQFPFYFLQLIL